MISYFIIPGIVSLTSSLFIILLFTILYIKKIEPILTRIFLLLIFAAAITSLGSMMINTASSYSEGIIWQKIQHIGISLIMPFYALFVNYYCNIRKKWYFRIIFLISFLIIFSILFTDLIITNEHYLFKGYQKIGKEGILYTPFITFFSGILIFEFIKFIIRYTKNKINRATSLPIIIGIGIAILCGIKDFLETFFDTGIPMIYEVGLSFMCVLFAYSLMLRFIRMHEELESKKRIEHEIKIALDIQSKILPRTNSQKFDTIELAAYNQPAYEVGGDFYDFFLLDKDKIAFVIADVCGKSVPAALYMAMIWSAIRSIAPHYKYPATVLQKTNNFLFESSREGMFATLIYGIYDKNLSKITYSSAGHSYPIYYDSKIEKFDFLKFQNKPLGVLKNLNYCEHNLNLKLDDIFLIYTDGIIEAQNCQNIQFGEDRLLQIIEKNKNVTSNELINKIVLKIKKFYGDCKLYDDITMMAIKKFQGFRLT